MSAPYILVVDDEPDIRALVQEILEDESYEVFTAENGERARQALRDRRPDLILLDITMPEKSGVRFYREIKENPELADIPVVIVTGVTGYGGRPEDFQKFISSRKQVPPPNGFVAKPIDRDELLEVVRSVLS